jgi:hypothetical protein
MNKLVRPALLFVAIGLAIYAALYVAAEQLLWRHGHSNPYFKIATLPEREVDWVVLGASHAMTMDFADFNARMEKSTGQRIAQLAGPGTGPLYNRCVLEHFLRRHDARHLLYVVDSFAFYSRTWNEDRFADAKLLRRTPFEPALAGSLIRYARHAGVDPQAPLDYLSGFSKINNRERFEPDVWEGEAQFERSARASTSAVTKRIAYLYPEQTRPDARARYLGQLSMLLGLARQHGIDVLVIKMPLPVGFRKQLPDEAAFDADLAPILAAHGARFADFSDTIDDARMYFDTDHLNRKGLDQFFERSLRTLLRTGPP